MGYGVIREVKRVRFRPAIQSLSIFPSVFGNTIYICICSLMHQDIDPLEVSRDDRLNFIMSPAKRRARHACLACPQG